MKKLFTVLLVVLLAVALVACGETGSTDTPTAPVGPGENPDPTPDPTPDPAPDPTPDPVPDPTPEPELLNFEGISFEDKRVKYDGAEHTVEISGSLPEGTSVSYTDNKGTNAGTYKASCKLECEGYNTLVLNADLVIDKADIDGIEFNGDIVEYDTEIHSIFIVGNVPYGVSVSYTYNGADVSGVSEVGSYTVVATLTGDNYNTLEISAALYITSTEKLLNVVNFGGAIYFQNDLDGDVLYKYQDGELSKVNNDVAEYFFTDGDDLYYYSTSLFSKVIKKISAKGDISTVCKVDGEYLTTDGEYIYYAVNNSIFSTEENGIYRYALDGKQTEPERICTDKAAYLTISGDYMYYSNLSDGKRLYRVLLSGGESTLIFDKKAEYLIEDNGIIYFDAYELIGSAIHKYNISDGTVTKMSIDSGKYLAKVGNDIYYIGNDLLTSTIFGDGIYKLSVLSSGNLPGIKIHSADGNGFSSLTTDGEYLYFYKLNDKHLYRYDVSTGEELDLMAGFTPEPEEIYPVGNTVIAEYNGEIYYTNPLDGMMNGACLYKYNPVTKQHFKVLSDDVAGVWFHDGKMYYSTCVITNYALFRMDLSTGESVKISSARCENLIFDGEYLYYIKVNPAPTVNTIMRVALADIENSEIEHELIYKDRNVAITGMSKVGDTFYFVMNPAIGKQKLYSFTIGDDKANDLGEGAFEVVCDGDTLYFYDDADNAVKCYKGGTVTTLVSNVTVNDLAIAGGTLYFSSMAKTVGVYACDVVTLELTKISSSVGEAITVVDGEVWFISTAVEYTADYPIHKGDADCALYCYKDGKLEKK